MALKNSNKKLTKKALREKTKIQQLNGK